MFGMLKLSKLRLLPLTIFAAIMLLTIRVGDIWQGLSGLSVGGAEAQEDINQPLPSAPLSEVRDGRVVLTPGRVMGSEPIEEAKPSEGSRLVGDRENGADDDPALYTQAEIDLLQRLAERREKIEQREKEIDARDAMLKAAEAKITDRVAELKTLQTTIAGLIRTYDKEQNEKLLSLVKIYESMKPKDAAMIFSELDIDTLLSVAERMKERKLAPVMAKMPPSKAKEVTEELARLRRLPTSTQVIE